LSSFSELVGPLDQADHTPLYQQLQRALRQAIQTMRLGPDAALPPERDMADEFAVSRVTVRKALDGLVGEGLLTRKQGAGTFVTGRVEKSFSKLSSFTEDMISRGRTPRSAWLSKSTGSVTPEESLSMGLSPGSAVYRFGRIRYADEVVMALEYSTIAAFALPSPDAVESSLYAALEETHHRPMRALQRLRAVLLSPDRAELMGLSPKAAALLIERRGFLRDGRVVEVTHSYYRGDAYDFVAELSWLPA